MHNGEAPQAKKLQEWVTTKGRFRARVGSAGCFTGFTCRHIKSRRCLLDDGWCSLGTSLRNGILHLRVDCKPPGFCSLVILNHHAAKVWARARRGEGLHSCLDHCDCSVQGRVCVCVEGGGGKECQRDTAGTLFVVVVLLSFYRWWLTCNSQ